VVGFGGRGQFGESSTLGYRGGFAARGRRGYLLLKGAERGGAFLIFMNL